MSKYIRPLSVAVTALVVAGLAGLGYNAAFRGDDTYKVTAYFEKAIGLFPNSDVMILGVPVGKVTRVNPEGTRVRVDMEINDDHKVPADAFAQIVPISVISDRYVQLEPVYDGGPALEDGAVLALEDTQIPAELDDVFQQLKKLLDAIEPGRQGAPGALGKLIVQLNETLADREQELRGTLLYGAELTGTLADSRDNLSNLLVNLDNLFTHLAARASSIGSLNVNMATVMATLAESRDDLEGTLGNLARMTGEVGRVVREHGDRLGGDLRLAARITSAILRNRASVEESLMWLPVIGEKLAKAYHGGAINSTDVRDHTLADRCHELEDLPDPVKDVLEDIFEEFCGTTPQQRQGAADAPVAAPVPDVTEELTLDCDEEVRKVKRQLRRIEELGVPDDVKGELLRPMKRKLRRLAKECEELAKALEEGNLLDQILEDVGGIPELEELLEGPTDDADGLTGSAAGAAVAPPSGPGFWDRVGGWFSSLASFVGAGS